MMISITIKAATSIDTYSEVRFENFNSNRSTTKDNIKFELSDKFPYKIKITPPEGEKLKSVCYQISTDLKNYHEVFVPDTGRHYSPYRELTTFWGRCIKSRINNICMPVFILTGQDKYTDYIFGIIGENFESDFSICEPACDRALVAWMKRFTLEIKRGTEDYPLPDYALDHEGALIEYIYFKEGNEIDNRETWFSSLRKYADYLKNIKKSAPQTTDQSLLPYWCSWTDWHSDQVTEDVILENVREGKAIGIKNFIIDDGWFGPGLDSDWETKLNIGDWEVDTSKISDLKKLVKHIHSENANAIIWCAPHAVSPYANCFKERQKYLISNNQELMMTNNGFNSLCFKCPESREIMAEICCNLIKDYDFDGAKYDLFNCVKDEICDSNDHNHDTDSMIEGLKRTLMLIDQKSRKIKKDYIVELKQNYATPYLFEYGTIVRAGDTPYNPQGNFNRTIYNSSYTPYSLNDYQTITNADSTQDAIAIIVKMIAAGIPSYSIDLGKLSQQHKDTIKFFHKWYMKNIDTLKNNRTPLDPDLNSWLIEDEKQRIYILINNENRLKIETDKPCQIINSTSESKILLSFSKKDKFNVEIKNFNNDKINKAEYNNTDFLRLDSHIGDIISIL